MHGQLAGSFYKRHAITHRRALTSCRHTVSGSLSLRSRGSFHLSLTVLFSIAHSTIFSLGRWACLLPAGFLVSRRTQDAARPSLPFCLRGSRPLRPCFPSRSAMSALLPLALLLQPQSYWFGLLPFRSPLLGESLLFSSPPGTWMFRFPGCLCPLLCVHKGRPCISAWRVPPFGYRRVFASLQLAAAFRSLARPSSVSSGKASSVRPCFLDLTFFWFSTMNFVLY